MSLKTIEIGDYVSALNEAISGVVVAIDSDITLETSDGFTMSFAPKDLVIEPKTWLETKDFVGLTQKKVDHETGSKSKRPKRRKKDKMPPMIVDLHIEKLVKDPRILQPWQILDFQIDSAKNQLEWALNKRKQRIVFIHGIGQGVLKAELETLLRRYDNIRFYPANAAEFGAGAIEVYRLQNTK